MKLTIPRIFKRSYTVRFIYWLLVLNWVDLISMGSPSRKHTSAKKRVVFVRMDGIGDLVIWRSVFERIRELYPSSEYERVLVGNERWRELSETETTFEEQMFVDRDRFVLSIGYRLRMLKMVRSLGADVVVNPCLSRDFLWGDSIVRASGSPNKIGSAGIDNLLNSIQDRISRRWYTELVPSPNPGEHHLISNCRFLGISETDCLELQSPSLLHKATVVPGEYALFFVGAFSQDRCWPAERFAETAGYVSTHFGLKIVLGGGPGEASIGSKFRSAFDGDITDLIGTTSLTELTGVIASAKLIVSNDTGAAHIAALGGRPTVVIAPKNEVGKYFPYPDKVGGVNIRQSAVFRRGPACASCRPACIETKSQDQLRPCIEDIHVKDVIDAIRGLMEKRN